MKITREKRLDKIVCSWKDNKKNYYEVELTENGNVFILSDFQSMIFNGSQVKNLIEALDKVINL